MARPKRQHLKQRKDGRYKAVEDGIPFMGWTEEEALQKRQDYHDAKVRGELLNRDGITVFTYALEWLPVHKASVAKNTYNAYANYIDKLTGKIGTLPMKSVTPTDIKSVYNEYLGQSESTIRKARMLYVDMWDCAIEDGIVKSNPCRSKGSQPHEGTSGSHRALSQEEDDLILNCPADLRLAVLLMRYAGLRRGEVMAFDIDKNVDFKQGIIIIKEAIHFEGNRGVLSDPKTDAGKRSIPLLDLLKNELKGHHGPVCPLKKTDIMTTSAWRSLWDHYIMQLELYANSFTQKRWYHRTKEWKSEHPDLWAKYEALKKKNPEQAEEFRLSGWNEVSIRPHDLRHSYATMLRDAGVDLKLAILWMGHADEKMLLRIYDHPPKDRVKRTVKSLNSFVKGANRGAKQNLNAV